MTTSSASSTIRASAAGPAPAVSVPQPQPPKAGVGSDPGLIALNAINAKEQAADVKQVHGTFWELRVNGFYAIPAVAKGTGKAVPLTIATALQVEKIKTLILAEFSKTAHNLIEYAEFFGYRQETKIAASPPGGAKLAQKTPSQEVEKGKMSDPSQDQNTTEAPEQQADFVHDLHWMIYGKPTELMIKDTGSLVGAFGSSENYGPIVKECNVLWKQMKTDHSALVGLHLHLSKIPSFQDLFLEIFAKIRVPEHSKPDVMDRLDALWARNQMGEFSPKIAEIREKNAKLKRERAELQAKEQDLEARIDRAANLESKYGEIKHVLETDSNLACRLLEHLLEQFAKQGVRDAIYAHRHLIELSMSGCFSQLRSSGSENFIQMLNMCFKTAFVFSANREQHQLAITKALMRALIQYQPSLLQDKKFVMALAMLRFGASAEFEEIMHMLAEKNLLADEWGDLALIVIVYTYNTSPFKFFLKHKPSAAGAMLIKLNVPTSADQEILAAAIRRSHAIWIKVQRFAAAAVQTKQITAQAAEQLFAFPGILKPEEHEQFFLRGMNDTVGKASLDALQKALVESGVSSKEAAEIFRDLPTIEECRKELNAVSDGVKKLLEETVKSSQAKEAVAKSAT